MTEEDKIQLKLMNKEYYSYIKNLDGWIAYLNKLGIKRIAYLDLLEMSIIKNVEVLLSIPPEPYYDKDLNLYCACPYFMHNSNMDCYVSYNNQFFPKYCLKIPNKVAEKILVLGLP